MFEYQETDLKKLIKDHKDFVLLFEFFTEVFGATSEALTAKDTVKAKAVAKKYLFEEKEEDSSFNYT